MKTVPVVYVGVLALSLSLNGLLLLGGSARADKTCSVATVDMAQLTAQVKQSPTWLAMSAKLTAERDAFRAELQHLTRTRYLTKLERTALTDLIAKATPTQAERRQIEELEGKSSQLDREFQELATIEKPTEAQRIRLKDLQRLRELGIDALRDQTTVNSRRITEAEEDLLNFEQRPLKEAASAVARQKRLELVVDRQVVLFGGEDVTAEVLGQLKLK